jgi:hypothetical protein
LIAASSEGHLEVVRLLLGSPNGQVSINHRDQFDRTALWKACRGGRGGVVRALLDKGADPTISRRGGTTPMAAAKEPPLPRGVTVEGRRECVAALEVSSCLRFSCPAQYLLFDQPAEAWGILSSSLWQEAERAYLLWKARQVADQEGSGAVAVEGEERKALLDFAVHGLKGDLFTDLMEYMG